MEYYIYIYLDLDNVPFYIGKGKDDRYFVSKHLGKHLGKLNSNLFLKRKIRKVGKDNVKIQFIKENLTEQEAFCLERFWIKLIGRRDQGKGPLCNLTDGGEGISGNIRSEELRQHLSKVVKEAWKRKGGHSKESKRKMIEARTGMKRSEETKKKISISVIERFHKSRGHSEKAKQKIGDANRGRVRGPLSKEIRQKISTSNLGKNLGKPGYWTGKKMSKEAKEKMGGPRKPLGPKSEETRQKMKAAQQRRRNKERKFNGDNK